MKQLLKPSEAAARLRVSPGTLADWRRNGNPPTYIKLNGSYRYPVEFLEEFERCGLATPKNSGQ